MPWSCIGESAPLEASRAGDSWWPGCFVSWRKRSRWARSAAGWRPREGKLRHVGLESAPKRSTLASANEPCPGQLRLKSATVTFSKWSQETR